MNNSVISNSTTPVPDLDSECMGFQTFGRRIAPLTFWFILPFLLISALGIWYLSITNGEISKDNYWLVQKDLFLNLNHYFTHFPDWFWSNVTELGNAMVVIPLLSFLIIVRPQAWAAILSSIPMAGSLSVLGKNIIAMPRPGLVLDTETFNVVGKLLKGYSSLPSGHSITIVAALVAVLATLYPDPRCVKHWSIVVVCLLGAGFVCLSRVAVGAHWPYDLLLGFAFGWIGGLSGAILASKNHQWWMGIFSEKGRMPLALALYTWSIILFVRGTYEVENAPILLFSGSVAVLTSLWLMNITVFRRLIASKKIAWQSTRL